MAGQSHIIDLFSKACRGELFSKEEEQNGNLLEEYIFSLVEDHEADTGTETLIHDPPLIPTKVKETSVSHPNSIWGYFIFPQTALSALKLLALKTVKSGYVSTDDVLSAYVWQSVTRARFPRLDSATTKSTFDRLVDVRKLRSISPNYIGNAVSHVSNTLAAQDIVQEHLGVIASQLRTSLNSISNISYKTRAATTILNKKTGAKNNAAIARQKVPTTDIKMSSWAKEKCYGFDFGGLLGKPMAVRRPRFEAWEGLAYLIPKTLDGEIVLALCLREEDLENLKVDSEFGKFGTYIG